MICGWNYCELVLFNELKSFTKWFYNIFSSVTTNVLFVHKFIHQKEWELFNVAFGEHYKCVLVGDRPIHLTCLQELYLDIYNFKLAQQKLYKRDVNIHQYFRAVGRPRGLSIVTHLNYNNHRMWLFTALQNSCCSFRFLNEMKISDILPPGDQAAVSLGQRWS